MYEVVSADKNALIKGVAINGRVTFIDRAIGRERTETIASAFATRKAIQDLDPSNIDPVICFRSLKGLIAPPSDSLVPVTPVMVLNKEDRRIVEGKDVLSGTNSQANLASMDWDDFEHLVRQLFEREFAASAGAEVKVTRASRDYGVDAIVFDPDPIRGGKYVIQAKRYTIPVDVAAVRDLYGTIMNEGAVKGLLVTTSHFGPDSYDFAKDKPITLLDGANLLALFKKHGFDFSIDIAAARAKGA
jgi:restriction system protein